MKADGVVGMTLTTAKQRPGADEVLLCLCQPRLYRLVHKGAFPCQRLLLLTGRTPHRHAEARRGAAPIGQSGTPDLCASESARLSQARARDNSSPPSDPHPNPRLACRTRTSR